MKKKIFRFKQVLLILTFLLIAVSCNTNQKFDSDKWKQKGLDWWMTDIRENMVEDLIQSDTILGMTRENLVELLGEPESKKEIELSYLIREKYGSDIDPEYISHLRIELNDNGRAIRCEIKNKTRI